MPAPRSISIAASSPSTLGVPVYVLFKTTALSSILKSDSTVPLTVRLPVTPTFPAKLALPVAPSTSKTTAGVGSLL